MKEAQAAFSKGEFCAGAKTLAAALVEAQALQKTSHNSVAEDLHNRIWTLRQDILSTLPEGRGCEDSPRINRAPVVEILESDDEHLRGRIAFGEARMTTIKVDNEL